MVRHKRKRKPQTLYPKCDWKYCRNHGTLFPVLVMPMPDWAHALVKEKTIEMEMDLNVCTKHSEEPIDSFLDDAGWDSLRQGLAVRKMPIPERGAITLIFKALEDRRFAQ